MVNYEVFYAKHPGKGYRYLGDDTHYDDPIEQNTRSNKVLRD